MPHLLSAAQLDRPRIERLLAAAEQYRDGAGNRYPGTVVGLAFFEDSLRTRVGFSAAAARLESNPVPISAVKQTAAMGQPESVLDTVRSIDAWCDTLCLRHPDPAVVAAAAAVSRAPVVNCGSGPDEHPTQALVDLFAIRRLRGGIDALRIGLIGDLHAMRTPHSLCLALANFDGITVRGICPPGLELPDRFADPLRHAGHTVTHTTEMDVEDLDAVYVAGLPAPTRIGQLGLEDQARFHVTAEVAGRLGPHGLVLCPLPRIDEITTEVDELPQAAYFEQSALGLFARMAVLDELLGRPSD